MHPDSAAMCVVTLETFNTLDKSLDNLAVDLKKTLLPYPQPLKMTWQTYW